jgi:hypothetical protein
MEARRVKTREAGLQRSRQPGSAGRRRQAYPIPGAEQLPRRGKKNKPIDRSPDRGGFAFDQPTAHAGRVPWFLNGVRPALARGYFNGKEPQAPAFSERGRLRRSETKASRQSRQPQERQHSAAEGGTRDRLPPASDSRATSRLVGINFAFVISSQCCACRYTACACSLSQFLQRTTWPRKRRRQRRPRRQPPRRWQRRLQRKRNSRIRD